jgi:hypothetical protein
MAIFKRGRVYWYHFIFNGEHVQESTKQGNPRVARQMEAAHKTALAKGAVGIREKKPIPTLAEFIRDRFEPWAKAQFEFLARWISLRNDGNSLLLCPHYPTRMETISPNMETSKGFV